MRDKRESLAPSDLALFIVSKVFLSGLLSLIGTSDMNSTPPAMTVSQCPLAIIPIPANKD